MTMLSYFQSFIPRLLSTFILNSNIIICVARTFIAFHWFLCLVAYSIFLKTTSSKTLFFRIYSDHLQRIV